MPRKPIDEFIDRQRSWLDPLGKTLAEGIGHAAQTGGGAGAKVIDFLHGVWLGHPLHAAITDVPVGAWTVGVTLDAVDTFAPNKAVRNCADGAIAIGLLGGLAAAPAGAADWRWLSGHNRRLGLVHGLLNTGVTLTYAVSLLLRRTGARPLGVSLGTLAYLAAGFSAYLGGEMVYGAGIGVDHTAFKRPPKDFVPVLPESQLAENELTKVTAKGVDLVLVKRHGHIHALDHTCTHLGGPLAEGKLEDDAIVCPWHGSTFALEDGGVIRGPATFAERVYEVRVNDGQIEVRVEK